MKNYELYIDGQYTPSTSDDWISVENPATKEEIAKVPAGNEEDVNKAVEGAKKALPAWKNMPIEERIKYIEKMVEYFENNAEEITNTVISELGSAVKISRAIHLDQYIDNAKDFIRIAKDLPMVDYHDGYNVIKEPVGVVACLTPWNFPFGQIEKKVIPALLMGNTVVLKPSQKTPQTGYFFTEAADYANLPAGVLQMVTGRGSDVGNVLSKHKDVHMISFTGSTKGGKEVAQIGFETVKRLALELGGKSASILLEGADYEEAILATLNQVYPNAGQACSSKTRLLAPRKDRELVEKIVVEQSKKFKYGNPTNPENDYGAIISQEAYDKVMGYIDLGKKELELLYEGEWIKDNGYFIPPIVFTNVDNSHKLAQEEIFGPVLVIIYYNSVEEAIEIANDSIYGLHGHVFGPEDQAIEVAKQIDAGQIIINDGNRTQNSPFGGYKQSGVGREGGIYGLLEYTELKTLFVNDNSKYYK